jgi:hypothetical protein
MKTEKLYRAKSIIIGKVESRENDYYLDIIDTSGNQQTIVSGDLEYVTKYVSKIIFI